MRVLVAYKLVAYEKSIYCVRKIIELRLYMIFVVFQEGKFLPYKRYKSTHGSSPQVPTLDMILSKGALSKWLDFFISNTIKKYQTSVKVYQKSIKLLN